MKKKINMPLIRIFELLFIMVLILSAMHVYLVIARNNNMKIVEDYVQEMANSTSTKISSTIDDRLDTIKMAATIYERLDENDRSNGEFLKEIETESGFDAVRFADKDGYDYTSEGAVIDISKREYFIEGMKGKTGFSYVESSVFDNESILILYSPVYNSNDEPIGLLFGVLRQNTINEMIDSSFMGYDSSSWISTKTGKVIAQASKNSFKAEDSYIAVNRITESDKEKYVDAFEKQEKCLFHYTGYNFYTVGSVIPIDGTDWSLVQLFPSQASQKIITTSSNTGKVFFTIISMLFIAYIVIVIFQYKHDAKIKSEREEKIRVKDSVNKLLRCVSSDYFALIEIDIMNNNSQVTYALNESLTNDMSFNSRNYNDNRKYYAEHYVAEYDQKLFLEKTNIRYVLDYLKSNEAYYFEYDVIINSELLNIQEKYTKNNSYGNEHLVVGIRNITDIKNRESQRKTQLDLIVKAASTAYPFIEVTDFSIDRSKALYNNGLIDFYLAEDNDATYLLNELSSRMPFEDEREAFLQAFDKNNQIEAIQHGKNEITLQFRLLDKDNNIHWMEKKNILIQTDDNSIFCITLMRNIDSEIKQTVELREAKEKAEEATKAKTMFLFNMSHDIRTPMNAIIGFTDLIKKNVNNPEIISGYLSKIEFAEENLLSLINNVLEMSRIESGTINVENVPLDISLSNDRIMAIMYEEANKKNITLVGNANISHPYIYGDINRSAEVVLNILSNAIKYTPCGGKVEYTYNQIILPNNDECIIEFICKDTGIGMSKEFVGRAFDYFSREKSTTMSGVQGTGLGLAIVKKLLETMDGTIEIESELGKGTTVTTRIKHKLCHEDIKKLESEELLTQMNELKGKRILLVEDNSLNLEIAKTLLEDEGCIVSCATDGDVAVEMIEESNPGDYDLVLMDIQMPKMDGYEATKAIRNLANKELADIPIVAMTANAFSSDKEKAKSVGMNGHIAKPISIGEIKKQISGLKK